MSNENLHSKLEKKSTQICKKLNIDPYFIMDEYGPTRYKDEIHYHLYTTYFLALGDFRKYISKELLGEMELLTGYKAEELEKNNYYFV